MLEVFTSAISLPLPGGGNALRGGILQKSHLPMHNGPLTPVVPAAHHVFVDCENVQSIENATFPTDGAHFTLLFGPRQKRVELAFMETLMNHAASVRIARLESAGKNALDLALAYYIGRCLALEPSALVHIVSADRGYDPLIEHLNREKPRAWRHDSFAKLPFPRVEIEVAPEHHALADQAWSQLERDKKSRPRRKKTLISYLRGPLKLSGGDLQLEPVIALLQERGLLQVTDKGAIVYS